MPNVDFQSESQPPVAGRGQRRSRRHEGQAQVSKALGSPTSFWAPGAPLNLFQWDWSLLVILIIIQQWAVEWNYQIYAAAVGLFLKPRGLWNKLPGRRRKHLCFACLWWHVPGHVYHRWRPHDLLCTRWPRPSFFFEHKLPEDRDSSQHLQLWYLALRTQ